MNHKIPFNLKYLRSPLALQSFHSIKYTIITNQLKSRLSCFVLIVPNCFNWRIMRCSTTHSRSSRENVILCNLWQMKALKIMKN